MNPLVIAIDFDGTCVTHEYPSVGKDIGAVPVLKELVENGHKLILYTMRSGKQLNDAVDWFNENGISLYGVQTNPTQCNWTDSNKCYANLYIDDAALGTPLISDKSVSKRDFVNWSLVREFLFYKGLFKTHSEIKLPEIRGLNYTVEVFDMEDDIKLINIRCDHRVVKNHGHRYDAIVIPSRFTASVSKYGYGPENSDTYFTIGQTKHYFKEEDVKEWFAEFEKGTDLAIGGMWDNIQDQEGGEPIAEASYNINFALKHGEVPSIERVSPKEQAEQLYNEMKGFRVTNAHRKKCALVAAKKCLKATKGTISSLFWSQVIVEIEKL